MTRYAELLARAEQLVDAGHVDQAVSTLRQAIALDPAPAAAHYSLGLAQHSQGDARAAIFAFWRAAERDPHDASIYNNLGALYYAEGDMVRAEQAYLTALPIAPQYAEARYGLARAHQRRGLLREAAAGLRQCLEIDPTMQRARKHLATIEAALSSPPDAWPPARRRILIRGGGFENKGAEAMVRTVQHEIGRLLPGAEFVVEAPPSMVGLLRSKGLEPLLPGVRGRYRDIDAVLDVSGFALGDSWGADNAARYAAHNAIFEGQGQPVVFLPQSWGPFTSPAIRQHTVRALRLADLTFARDALSMRYLRALEDVPEERLELAPDITLCFRGASAAEGRRVLETAGVAFDGHPLIGLIPNLQVYQRTEGQHADNRYIHLLVTLARRFITHHGCQVVLLPHTVSLHAGRDDRLLCRLIHEALQGDARVVHVEGYHSAEIVKACIGQMSFVIGSRFHGLVAAISQMVPCVALGWSHKYHELLGDVGLGDYVMDHTNLSAEAFCTMVEEAWTQREQIEQTLVEHVPAQQVLSATALRRAAQVIAERCPA